MRPAAASPLAFVVALTGCLGFLEHGCEPYGGEVAWHQPESYQAALALANGSESHVLPGPVPMGYALPAGDPVYARFGEGARLAQVRVGPISGGASVNWAPNGTQWLHHGGDEGTAQDAARRLVQIIAAEPAAATAWAERHQAEFGDGRTEPIELDLPLDVAGAFRAVDEAPVKALYSARHELADGDVVWTVSPVHVTVQRGAQQAYVTAGDWVVAHVTGGNLTDPEVAGRRGSAVAQAVGLPAGPQSQVQVKEVLLCG